MCLDPCWAVLKCWPDSRPGSQPDSHHENRLTHFNVRTQLETDLRFSHDREPVQMYTHIHIGEPDRFSHRTGIRFSEFCVSFTGSSCSSSHLGLLLFFFTAVTVLPLLLFSLYWYYSSLYYYYFFPIALILFLLLLLFSHMVLLFSCDDVI